MKCLQASQQVLQAGATEEKGETARMVSYFCIFLCKSIGRLALALLCVTSRRPPVCPRARAVPLQAAFIGAMAIADLVKTTLGPKGMVSFFQALSLVV